MSQQTAWHATVSYTSAPTPISEDQADALTSSLPGYAIAHHDGRHIHLSMTVEASTLRKATEDALKAARAAYAAAFDVVGTETAIRVLTEAEHQQEIAHPDALDLVGVTDVAAMAGVTQQRASQIVDLSDFPAPVAAPGGRKTWTRKSVEAFLAGWSRLGGWEGKKAREQATVR